MMRFRITIGAISTSMNMTNVEPSLPSRSTSACTRLAASAITTTRDADDEPARPHVRGVERQEQHEPEQHADDEAAPQALVIRDRDHHVEHDQEREQQPVAVAAGEALGVVLAVEVASSVGGAIRASVDARARRWRRR